MNPPASAPRETHARETHTRDRAVFARLGTSWHNPEVGAWKALAAMNEARLAFIYRELIYRTQGRADKINPQNLRTLRDLCDLRTLRALDFGCGGGLTALPLAATGISVRAVDDDPTTLAAAKARLAKTPPLLGKLEFAKSNLKNESRKKQRYDLVLCLEVVEHVYEPDVFVKNLCGLVKEGGLLVISTLNRTGRSYLSAIAFAEYLAGLVPVGTHEWQRFVPPETLQEWVESKNMKPQAIAGLVPSALGGWRLDSRRLACNYIASFVKPANVKPAKTPTRKNHD